MPKRKRNRKTRFLFNASGFERTKPEHGGRGYSSFVGFVTVPIKSTVPSRDSIV